MENKVPVRDIKNVVIAENIQAGGPIHVGDTIIQYQLFLPYEKIINEIAQFKDLISMLNSDQLEPKQKLLENIEELEKTKASFHF